MIAQLKKDFLSSSPPKPTDPAEKTTPEKKTNKYLKTENKWSGPPQPQPGGQRGTNGVIEDTVQAFQAPQIHHAEVVNLRQDTSSESDDDESGLTSIRQNPASLSTSMLTPQPLSLFEQQQLFLREQEELERKFREEREQLQREHDLLMKQQELLLQQQQLPQHQQYQQQYQQQQVHLQPQQHQTQTQHQYRTQHQIPQQQMHQPQQLQQQQQQQQQQYYPPQPQHQQQQQHQQYQGQVLQHVHQKPGLDRSFEDPAYAAYQDEMSSPSSATDPQESESPGKKKGFFSSFFKKPSPGSSGKKGRGGRGRRPRSEYVPDDDDQGDEDQSVPERKVPKSQTDVDLHLHTLERSPVRLTPVVPQPGSSPMPPVNLNVSRLSAMHKNESMITHPGMSFEQELDPDFNESFSDEPLPQQPLQRKLSMSKPTDLDELMRLQEQVTNEGLFIRPCTEPIAYLPAVSMVRKSFFRVLMVWIGQLGYNTDRVESLD